MFGRFSELLYFSDQDLEGLPLRDYNFVLERRTLPHTSKNNDKVPTNQPNKRHQEVFRRKFQTTTRNKGVRGSLSTYLS